MRQFQRRATVRAEVEAVVGNMQLEQCEIGCQISIGDPLCLTLKAFHQQHGLRVALQRDVYGRSR